MLCFDGTDPVEALRKNVERAVALRRTWVASSETTGYRVINGEGDFIPGLIVDVYDKVWVVQVSTKGMALLRDQVLEMLRAHLPVDRIYEKSIMPSRQEEGLPPTENWLLGEPRALAPFLEHGMRFMAAVVDGQKTGFFLDQRAMRARVRGLASGRRVLNCFCYSGAFSVAALFGGAQQVTSVDISEAAIALTKEHIELNGFETTSHRCVAGDVFDFLRTEPLDYELVILDPPAFCKKKQDVVPACRGYKDINRLAMKGMPSGALLLTSSCSHYVDDELFQKVVFQASVEAGRRVRILDRHHLAADHPENLCHPEGHYLKSLLLLVE
jgi:23S rRNA (cytosine1962-C5)-methyltransferase